MTSCNLPISVANPMEVLRGRVGSSSPMSSCLAGICGWGKRFLAAAPGRESSDAALRYPQIFGWFNNFPASAGAGD